VIEGATAGRRHILTVVVEDYFQVGAFSRLIPPGNWERFETNLAQDTENALELLATTRCRATFFCSGWVADNYPRVVRRIVEGGHEVACQGYLHYRITDVSRDAFAADLRKARQSVEDASGKAVHGFRIGRGWIGGGDLWALDVLAEEGFDYDSSLRIVSGGAAQAGVHHRQTTAGVLYEVPPTRLSFFGLPLLLSGGNFLRQLPDSLLQSAVQKWLARHHDPLVFYFHSWELGGGQPRIEAGSHLQRLRHYRNLERMPEKVRHYLQRYDFGSIAEHLALETAPAPLRADPVVSATTAASSGPRGGRKRGLPLTLVIPCYNEADSLSYLDRTLARFAEKTDDLFELHCILVDDGSSDATWELLQQHFGGRERFTVLRHQSNRGIAAALVTGFQRAETDYVAALDADCTFDPAQLIDMMALMTDDTDVVAASPMHAQGEMQMVPVWRASLSRGAALLYRCILHNKLTSYTSCFRLYRRCAIESVNVTDPGFCGVTEILGRLDLAGCHVAEYPARLETRVLGRSKIKVVRTIFGHLKLAARLAMLRWLGRPMPGPTDMRTSYADAERK
jgi:polysaccharide deacetylase family protein (PEP-CTERM system associated)